METEVIGHFVVGCTWAPPCRLAPGVVNVGIALELEASRHSRRVTEAPELLAVVCLINNETAVANAATLHCATIHLAVVVSITVTRRSLAA
jgi:hypothetical protein